MASDRSLSGLSLLIARAERADTARRAMWFVWPVGLAIIAVVGRRQWFVADDWAFLLTRERMRTEGGWDTMLFAPQDGHWMTWPILVFKLLRATFGLGSYLPFLVVLWATHVGIVVLVRCWMKRLGVTPWTSTLVSAVLLVFGAGWENLVFAVQIVYNFSLLAFLGHLLLVDHEGPLDRRDAAGVGISLIGVSSSGFGPFFGFGVALLLVLRRRWRAALVAVVPQALVWLWWAAAWGDSGDRGESSAGLRFVLDFLEVSVRTAFGSLLGTEALGVAAFVLCLGVVVWPATSGQRRPPMIALLATVIVMLAGIGSQRYQDGLESAVQSRYQYVVAMLAAPVLAVGLDQAPRFASWARWLPRALLVFALARNVVWMDQRSDAWASISSRDRRVFELVAGSPDRDEAAPDKSMTSSSPDVRIADLDELVDDGAVTPDPPPSTPEEHALVRHVLFDPAPIP